MERAHPRLKVSLAVSYRTTGSFLVAYSVNLSKGGLFIEATPLVIGATVHIELAVPGSRSLGVDGVVTWVRERAEEGRPVGMGIQFGHEIDEALGRHIDSLVASFEGLEVLVVAAVADRRSLLVRYVQNIVDCEIIEAPSAAGAEAAIADGVDLVVVDLDSAGLEGMDVILRTQKSQGTPAPIIALAADGDGRAWARKRGLRDVLATPPVFAELQAAVIGALARPVVK